MEGGSLHAACNVENASYGLTICAERNAIFGGVAAGHRRLVAVALACVDAQPGAPGATLMPCGACRQVMAEFGHPEMPVFIDNLGRRALRDLLPEAFALG